MKKKAEQPNNIGNSLYISLLCFVKTPGWRHNLLVPVSGSARLFLWDK